MKKTKIKQRVANAFDAFRADENSVENDLMNYAADAGVRRRESANCFNEKNSNVVQSLKRGFLFFPGTFFLFVISLGVTLVSAHSPKIITIIKMSPGRTFTVFLFFAIAILMTWFGLGDLRKPKHFVIPASIAALGIIVGAIGGALAAASPQIERLIFLNNFPVYFFPLALMIPILAKGWVDMKDENYSGKKSRD